MPADLRRRILVEAGHRCAIPTCRYIEVDVHHIIPWAQCQAHEYDNLIALCPNCHRRADRGEIDRKSLRLYKANLRFIHDKYSQLEIDLLFDLYPNKVGLWLPAMRILIKRIGEAGLVAMKKSPSSVVIVGMQMAPDEITLTDKGRQFIEDLGITAL